MISSPLLFWFFISLISFLNCELPLPIVYVYTVVGKVCSHGLPKYIRISLEQAVFTQPDAEVYLIANIGECSLIQDSLVGIKGVQVIDSKRIESQRTRTFHNLSSNMFASDGVNELWITSALRFFMLEDVMIHKKWFEMMHVEADNLLYGRFSTILPVLRKHYPLAVTPLNAQKSFLTASVFWVNSFDSLLHFNNYLLGLGRNSNGRWKEYLKFMRYYACCKPGGVDPDAHGQGIKPFAINEMSMLAYYHDRYPKRLRLLPVVPAHPYVLNRYIINASAFGPGGSEIVAPTGHGIWDPNSWGQLIGGTSVKKGRDVGFSDATHISGQAIRVSQCEVQMRCANMTEFGYAENFPVPANETKRCYTAPFTICHGSSRQGYNAPWTPLWNLHVHSKHTGKFKSHLCDCSKGMEQEHRPHLADM